MDAIDEYAHWRAVLSGENPPIEENRPQCGFWKRRFKKGGEWVPVAIWRDGSEWRCVVGDEQTYSDIDKHWVSCARNAISDAEYDHWREHKAWPGTAPAAATAPADATDDRHGIGGNNPPESIEDIVAAEIDDAMAWLTKQPQKGEVDELIESAAANRKDALHKLFKRIEAEHEEKKRPILDEGRRIDGKYKPLMTRVEEAKRTFQKALGVWMGARQDRLNAEHRKAQVEALAAQRAKEAEWTKAVVDGGPMPEDVPPPLPVAAKPVKVQAGGALASKTGLRTKRTAVIKDYDEALAHFADTDPVREVVQKLAQKAVDAKLPVPGVEVLETKVAY